MIDKHYQDGYQTGLSWKNNWVPGGPWVCDGLNPRYKKMSEETKKENNEWQEGFRKGLEDQNKA